ncbi:Kelch repeat-containing protein [Microlunatus ginsengisoli]|uniref:hypothetical protein n=1 Tax=Microlunatus ginsengisoli TaxID=363863 RepID=UPI0031E3070E
MVVGNAAYVLIEKTEQEAAALLRYEPTADRWARLALPSDPSATLVAGDHRVFAVPGFSDGKAVRLQALDTASAEVSWRTLPADPLGSADYRQATWFDGRLMLAGPPLATGSGGAAARVRITWWDQDSDTWTKPVDGKVTGWDPTTVGARIVWPGHGDATSGSAASGGIYDPDADRWADLPDPLDLDGLDRASGLVVGSRIVIGEPSAGADSGRGQLLDPVSRHWTAIAPLPGPPRFAAATAASVDEIFVWGGGTAKEENLADGYLLRVP